MQTRVRLSSVLVGVVLLFASQELRAKEDRETPQSDARSSATSLTVVTRQEIERRQWRTLVEVLQAQPGLHVSQLGGLGQPVQIFARGQRRGSVLVRLDGVEVSDPASKDPGTVLPDLLTVELEHVEIRRGPQGIEAGNDALGGVIDIATRRGSGPFTPWAKVEAGAFGTYQSSGGVRGGSESVDYTLGYTHLHSRGINAAFRDGREGERDGYDNDSLGGRVDLRPGDGLRLGLTGRFVDSERGADSDDVSVDDPTEVSPSLLFRDREGSEREARRLFLRGEAELALFEERWIQQWSIGYTDHQSQGHTLRANPSFFFVPGAGPTLAQGPDLRPVQSKDDSDSSRLELAWTNELRLAPKHRLRIGAQIDNETFRGRQVDQNANLLGPLQFSIENGVLVVLSPSELQSEFITASHERARNLSAFAEDHFGFGDFFGEVGVGVQDHDEFGSELNYRVGLGYIEPRTQLRIFGSFGTASRDPRLPLAADRISTSLSRRVLSSMGSAPGFTVDSGPPSVSSLEGVTDADAERIRGAEIGVDAPFLAGRGSVGISLFSTRSRRVATSDTVGVQFRDVVQLFDVEPLETRARGVESWLRLDVSESLGLQLDYVYTRSRLGHDLGVLTQLGLEAGGDAELGIPRHRADVSVRYAPFQTLEGWIAARYVGTRRDERAAFRSSRPALLSGGRVGALFAATEQTTRGAYTTFDLGFSWQLRPGLTLFARVENLFDREYNDPPTTNSPGRAGYLGLQLEMR